MTNTRPKRSVVPVITWSFVALTLVVGVVIARSAKHKERVTREGAATQSVSVSGTALAKLPDSGTDPAVGVKAPELRGSGFDGTPVTIGAVSDKRTLIAFVAHWCPHCNREVPRIITWWGSSARPGDLNLVAVSTAVDKSLPNYPPSTWLQDKKWTEPVMADSAAREAAAAYGLTGFPFLVLLDGNGNVIARTSGERTLDELATFAKQGQGQREGQGRSEGQSQS